MIQTGLGRKKEKESDKERVIKIKRNE